MTRAFRTTLVSVALCAITSAARAQGFVEPSALDPVTRELERLVAQGATDAGIMGQRPWTRAEVVRLLESIETRLAADTATAATLPLRERVAALLAIARPAAGARGLRLDVLGLEAALLDSPSRPVELTTGIGAVRAEVNPFTDARAGRVLGDGGNLQLFAGASLRAGRRLELVARARGWAASQPGDDLDAAFERLAAHVQLGNAVLTVGRDHVTFGQGASAMLLSANAPPLDMVRVTNAVPFRLPSLLRYLGPGRGTLLLATLDGTDHFEGERLAAWKLSFLPAERFEIGVTVASQQGGSGAPPARFAARVADLVPLIDAIFIGDRDLQISNKFAGMDSRLRIPEWRGLSVYADVLLDDFDVRRWKRLLWEDGGWVAGFDVPALAADGRLGLTVEHHHTGLRYYRHGEFRSGLTHDDVLLGNPLGPEANALYARLRLDRGPLRWIGARGAYERRSANVYVTSGGAAAGDGTLRFHLVERKPVEQRIRALLEAGHTVAGGRLRLEAETGVERVTAFANVAGSARTSGIVRLLVEQRF